MPDPNALLMGQSDSGPGDLLASRDRLLKAAHAAVGGMQAVAGFLRDRDDLSRDHLADEVEDIWRKLRAEAEKVPPLWPAGVEPKDRKP